MDVIGFIRSYLQANASAASRSMKAAAEVQPTQVVALNGQSVNATTTTGLIQVVWPCDGFLVGVRATTRDGAAASATGMLLRLLADGQQEMFPSATGSGAGFMPFAQISGSSLANIQGRLNLVAPFRQATQWQVAFNNTTGGTLVADVCFDIINVSKPNTHLTELG